MRPSIGWTVYIALFPVVDLHQRVCRVAWDLERQKEVVRPLQDPMHVRHSSSAYFTREVQALRTIPAPEIHAEVVRKSST